MSQKVRRNDDPLLQYAKSHSTSLHPVQQKLREATVQHEMCRMLGSSDELQLLQTIVACMNAKKTLDIGVYTGYSAMTIALALPDDGKVVACDIDEFARFGEPYWREAGVRDKVDLRIAPATETMEKLLANGEAGTYDFAFIDADKENYRSYYELCLKLLRKGGIIGIDNVLWNGKVLQPEAFSDDAKLKVILSLNDFIATDSRVSAVVLKIGDGTTIARKL